MARVDRGLRGAPGFGGDARLLIVNCDDLGVSRSANRAIERGLRAGIATSATLMVPCPAAEEAARMLRDLPVGVHLTLTAEYPGYRWRGLTGGRTLPDGEGWLPLTAEAALARLDPEDARAECRAQVDRALDWGVDVTHLDAHMNVMQARADLFDVYLDLAKAYAVPVRMFPPEMTDGYGFDARGRARAAGILFPDHMLYPWPRPTGDVLREQVPRLPPGVTEIFVHPVADGTELHGYDPIHAGIRTHDAACVVDPALAALLDGHGVVRISFREIRDLQRSRAPASSPVAAQT